MRQKRLSISNGLMFRIGVERNMIGMIEIHGNFKDGEANMDLSIANHYLLNKYASIDKIPKSTKPSKQFISSHQENNWNSPSLLHSTEDQLCDQLVSTRSG